MALMGAFVGLWCLSMRAMPILVGMRPMALNSQPVIARLRQNFIQGFFGNVVMHGKGCLRWVEGYLRRLDAVYLFQGFFDLFGAMATGHAGDLIGMCHFDFDFSDLLKENEPMLVLMYLVSCAILWLMLMFLFLCFQIFALWAHPVQMYQRSAIMPGMADRPGCPGNGRHNQYLHP